METLDLIPIDIIRYHILPFLRYPVTMINLGAVNENLRRAWKGLSTGNQSIIEISERRIPQLEGDLYKIEAELQNDPCFNLTRDLDSAAKSVSSFDFQTMNYEDPKALYLLSVFYTYIMLSEITPSAEDLMVCFHRENAITELHNVDGNCVPRSIFKKVTELIAQQEWTAAENQFSGQKEDCLIT